jgi:hypothetical protein
VLVAGGRAVAASADGTLLHDVAGASLPAVPVPVLPGGSRVADSSALKALSLLAVTPARLRRRISQVTVSSAHGLVVELRSGPSIYFGHATRLSAKWLAASAVLADPSSAGASYIDVTDPERPVAGVAEQAVVSAGLATTGSSTSSSSTGPPSQTAATGAPSQTTATGAPSQTTATGAPSQTTATAAGGG